MTHWAATCRSVRLCGFDIAFLALVPRRYYWWRHVHPVRAAVGSPVMLSCSLSTGDSVNVLLPTGSWKSTGSTNVPAVATKRAFLHLGFGGNITKCTSSEYDSSLPPDRRGISASIRKWMNGWFRKAKIDVEWPFLGHGGSSVASGLKLEQFSIAAPCSKQVVMGT